MGSWCQNAEKPPSKLLATTQDLEPCWPFSFQYQNFTHFNDYYDFKESNFHHCPSSVVDLYKGVLLHALQTKASLLLWLYIKFKSFVCDSCVFGKLG